MALFSSGIGSREKICPVCGTPYDTGVHSECPFCLKMKQQNRRSSVEQEPKYTTPKSTKLTFDMLNPQVEEEIEEIEKTEEEEFVPSGGLAKFFGSSTNATVTRESIFGNKAHTPAPPKRKPQPTFSWQNNPVQNPDPISSFTPPVDSTPIVDTQVKSYEDVMSFFDTPTSSTFETPAYTPPEYPEPKGFEEPKQEILQEEQKPVQNPEPINQEPPIPDMPKVEEPSFPTAFPSFDSIQSSAAPSAFEGGLDFNSIFNTNPFEFKPMTFDDLNPDNK